MSVRLVQFDGDKQVASRTLADRPVVIGRDPEVDIVVADGDISRRHVMIEPGEDGYFVSDLGSSNGTRLNGELVTSPVLLESGDEIELSERVAFQFHDGGLPEWVPWAGLSLAVVGVVALVGWFFLSGGPSTDPVLEEATKLAAQGVESSEAGNGRRAREKLDAAVGLLFTSGRLDDVEGLHVRQEGLRILQERLAPGIDLAKIYTEALEASRPTRPVTSPGGPFAGPCRLDRVGADDLDLCIRERSEQVLFELWQEPREIPEKFYGAVNHQLRLVLGRRRGWVESSLERGKQYHELMERELEAAKMPRMLRYLSMIESGFQPDIKSKAGARGLWQFMPATARGYGLRVSDRIDDRTDPEKSTRAAARYLRDLAFEFGGDALLLAIASYNKGENGIRRALKKLEDPRADRSYWSLVEGDLLPTETQEYVPRLIAAAIMGEAGVPSVEVVPRVPR